MSRRETLSRKVENWPLLGVCKREDSWIVIFRHKSWPDSRFVVITLFSGNSAFTVSYWSGSYQKAATLWKTDLVEDYPVSVVPQALTRLLEVDAWTR